MVLSPVTPIAGSDRAATLAMLCEAATRNAVWAPNPVPHQRRGRGRGLEPFLYAHPSCPTLEPITVGTGRARSRNSGPCPYLDTPCMSPTHGLDVCVHTGISPALHLGLTALLQKPPLDPHHGVHYLLRIIWVGLWSWVRLNPPPFIP